MKEKSVFKIKEILPGALFMLIIMSLTVSPVMGYNFGLTPATPYHRNISLDQYLKLSNSQPPVPRINYSTLTPEELKIEPNLLYLLYPDKYSMNISSKDTAVNLQNAITHLQNANLYKSGTVIEKDGIKIQTTPNLVYLDITLWPGNSTHILDPFIYEKRSSGTGDGISAWVEVSNIEKIARIPEIMLIRTVTYTHSNVYGNESQG